MFPTLADFAGIDAPEYTKQFEFASLIRGDSQGQPRLFGAYMPNAKKKMGVRAVREGDHKLLYYTHSGRQQLFDLKQDPWETNDLIGDPSHAQTAERLFAALQEWMKISGDPLGS
jgi:arylsulfatase A-like enzyme